MVRNDELNEKIDKTVNLLTVQSRYEKRRDKAERAYHEEQPTEEDVLCKVVTTAACMMEVYIHEESLEAYPTYAMVEAVRYCELCADDQFKCELQASDRDPVRNIPSYLRFVAVGFKDKDYDLVKFGLEGLLALVNYDELVRQGLLQ